ncbi:MAG: restriction endonuclease [Fimbriimonadaceae bacterium]
MLVPSLDSFLRPVLEMVAAHEGPLALKEARSKVFDILGVAEHDLDRKEWTTVFYRVTWSAIYLNQAGLLERQRRGTYTITSRGREVLRAIPAQLTLHDLDQFPEFLAFRQRCRTPGGRVIEGGAYAPAQPPHAPPGTPAEQIETAHQELTEQLVEDLLERLKEMSPGAFERLIVELMLRLGYGGALSDAGETLGRSGDGGVDGVIKQDKLGLDNVYLQAKRWSKGTVGRPDVQSFIGALTGMQAAKGVFITTASYSKEARTYAESLPGMRVSLIDGHQLARLMIDVDLGVTLESRYDVKRIDSDFFDEAYG